MRAATGPCGVEHDRRGLGARHCLKRHDIVETSESFRLAPPFRCIGQKRDERLGKGRGVPFRIPWNRLTQEKTSFKMDVDAESTPIYALEDWLREKIVDHIPGG